MSGMFGQLVIGPPGSGKTTYCQAMSQFLQSIGRKVAVVNIDPANEVLIYKAAINVSELITVEDAMANLNLGPNGGLMYCMEYLEKNMDWLFQRILKHRDHYFLFDCPGQVELYTHHNSMKKITEKLLNFNMHLCTIHLVDSHYCSDPAMLHMELPHVNVLSKIDLMAEYGDKLHFGIDYYMEVLDLNYLLDALDEDPITGKYKKLNAALVSLVEDYSLVTFLPLNVKDKQTLLRLKNAVDKANGYVYGTGEERNVQALLACAVGAEFEQERTGTIMDKYMDEERIDM